MKFPLIFGLFLEFQISFVEYTICETRTFDLAYVHLIYNEC